MEDFNLDIDLDELSVDDIDNMDLSSFGTVDTECDQDHFKVSAKQFKEMLKILKAVATTSGRDVVSKSIAMRAEDDKLVCYATDFDSYITYSCELLNAENVLKEPVVASIDVLIKLVKAVGTNVVIYKEDNQVYMQLVGGNIPLDTSNIDINKFILEDKIEKEVTINSKELHTVCKDLSGIVTAAVSPVERRILAQGNEAYASYMFAIVKANYCLGSADYKIRDINVLKSLLVSKDEEVEMYKTTEAKVPRKVITGKNFSYAFLVSDLSVSETLKSNMVKVESNDGVFVDLVQLYKMVEIAAELPYAIGKVGLNYDDNGDIKLAIKTKKGNDSVFTLNGSVVGNPQPLKKEVVLQAKLFRILLRVFSSSNSIRVSLTDAGLGIVTDAYSACLFGESN